MALARHATGNAMRKGNEQMINSVDAGRDQRDPVTRRCHAQRLRSPARRATVGGSGLCLACLLLLVGSVRPAHANYIDPGSGQLILQLLLGMGLGLVFYFRRAINRLLAWCRGKKSTDEQTSDDSSQG